MIIILFYSSAIGKESSLLMKFSFTPPLSQNKFSGADEKLYPIKS